MSKELKAFWIAEKEMLEMKLVYLKKSYNIYRKEFVRQEILDTEQSIKNVVARIASLDEMEGQ